jgi:hypothetical protein
VSFVHEEHGILPRSQSAEHGIELAQVARLEGDRTSSRVESFHDFARSARAFEAAELRDGRGINREQRNGSSSSTLERSSYR